VAGSADEQPAIAGLLSGQVTATVHGEHGEGVSVLVETLSQHAGRGVGGSYLVVWKSFT
jgi:hypothetical protein